jgi:hypothetical protein
MRESLFTKNHAREGAFEGNVRLPQSYLGYGVFGLETLLAGTNGKENIWSLLEPIPLDSELLSIRTKKANAQHRAHGIEKDLSPDRVRDMMAVECRTMLHLLFRTFCPDDQMYSPHEHDHIMYVPDSYAENGDFVSEREAVMVQKVLSEASEDDISMVARFAHSAAELLRTPEMVELQKRRKDQLKNWQKRVNLKRRRAKTLSVISMKRLWII